MVIQKRPKKSTTKKTERINVNFDLQTLNLICSYAIGQNHNIKSSHLMHLRNLMGMLNMENYISDQVRMDRIDFINRAIDGRLNHGISNQELLIRHISGGLLDSPDIGLSSYLTLSNDEAEWVSNLVSNCLKYLFISEEVDDLADICNRFRVNDYKNKEEIVQEFEIAMSRVQTKFRQNKTEKSTEATFSLKDGIFEQNIIDIHREITNPSSILLSGMQGVNEMIGGGFHSGRVYLLFGLPGEGKSTVLLNLAYQIKKHNKGFQTKDPTKTPCVVLLTMENTVRETVDRLFTVSSNHSSMINHTADEIINILRTEGELYLTDDSPIDIIIKFVPDKSVDTNYLYTLTENLEDEGYEVICLIQDYIKRIKSINHTPDLRIELGNIVNEFKTFAVIKDIPVISASQLNRDATKHIDEGRKTNKSDLLRLLGRSNIGESMLVLENTDAAFLIAPEVNPEGEKFMGIQCIKLRYTTVGRVHLYQPFVQNNGIKLVEDEGMAIPAFKESMSEGAPNGLISSQRSVYKTNSIKDLDMNMSYRKDEGDSNLFQSSYSSTGLVEAMPDVAYRPIFPLITVIERQTA